jgi:hypothetical protein
MSIFFIQTDYVQKTRDDIEENGIRNSDLKFDNRLFSSRRRRTAVVVQTDSNRLRTNCYRIQHSLQLRVQ